MACTFALACMGLASWQIERRSEAVAKIERVASNYDLEKVTLEDVSSLSGDSVVAYEWRKVELTGNYLVDDSLLVRNRAIAGQPGFVQLIPFLLETGTVIVVERGWIAADSNLNPSQEFLPSESVKTLLARVR
ncbi:MAG: hypothetical protein F2791_03200, partial [Actinobacteria bacterium]|nr:hypothetical protein [Actinomycetota bacterium]